MIEEVLRILPHYLICGSLPACTPILSGSPALVLLGCSTGTFLVTLLCPGAGSETEVSLYFLLVTSSCELQEHLHFTSLWCRLTLLKHFDLPGLDPLAQQDFSKVRNLFLKLCTKGAFQTHAALTQAGGTGNLSVLLQRRSIKLQGGRDFQEFYC